MFVGGGSGGHFYPLIAVAEALRARPEREFALYYIGPTPHEAAELDRLSIRFIWCPAGKQRRYFSLLNYLDVFKVAFGVFIAVIKLYVIYPDVIFSKGSFTSVPVVLAARFLRIPVVIHESDAIAGRANLLARSFAKAIGISYPEAAEYFPPDKTALTGIPLRAAILTPPRDPFAELGISADRPLILATGGSLGAEYLNNLLLRALPEILPHYNVVHLVSKQQLEEARLTAKTLLTEVPDLQNHYFLQGSVPGSVMAALLSAASLVISRSGSSSIHEIAYYGKPAILIPIPETVSRDQRSNAYAYARTGAAAVLEQGNLTVNLLTAEIKAIMGDQARYEAMAKAAKDFSLPAAATTVADLVTAIGIEHGS